jgi:hypothetical protein
MEERPPTAEDTCEYIQHAAAEKRGGVVSPAGVWACGLKPFTARNKFLTTVFIYTLLYRDLFDKRPRRRNMHMRFGFWTERSLNGATSLMTVSRELPKHNLGLLGVKEIRGKEGGTKGCGRLQIFPRKGNKNLN